MAGNADLERLFRDLGDDGRRVVERAFKRALANVEATAKELVPVGVRVPGRRATKKRRGRKPRPKGGQLKSSLAVQYLGRDGDKLVGRVISDVPYARRQHEEDYHHPGKYAGTEAGPRFKSKYVERAFIMIMLGEPDPLSGLGTAQPTERMTFAELLVELSS